jgi:hypothetical protein
MRLYLCQIQSPTVTHDLKIADRNYPQQEEFRPNAENIWGAVFKHTTS